MESLDQLAPFDRAFDADATANICLAFDKTCRNLPDKGSPDFFKEIVARRVIEIAARGERDPDRLTEATLLSPGLKPTIR
jgi:hypothetical protein